MTKDDATTPSTTSAAGCSTSTTSSSNNGTSSVKQRHILVFFIIVLLLLLWSHERSTRLALMAALEKGHAMFNSSASSQVLILYSTVSDEDDHLSATTSPVRLSVDQNNNDLPASLQPNMETPAPPSPSTLDSAPLPTTPLPPSLQQPVQSSLSAAARHSPPLNAHLLWSEEVCYQQSLLTNSPEFVALVSRYCPALLPTPSSLASPARTKAATTAPTLAVPTVSFDSSAPHTQELLPTNLPTPSVVPGARGSMATNRRSSPHSVARSTHLQTQPRTQKNQLPQEYTAGILCRFLNHSGCAFVHRGRMKVVRKGEDFPPPFPPPPSRSSVPGSKHALDDEEMPEMVKPTSLVEVIEEILVDNKSAAFVSGFSSCNKSSSSSVGLLSQSLSMNLATQLKNKGTADDVRSDDIENLKQRFAFIPRASSLNSSGPTSLNTIKWLSWRPERCEDGKLAGPKIQKRPSPTAYREPLEILATIRAFHKERFKNHPSKSDSHPRILFSGDSLCRQKFIRLVQLIRGEEVIPHTHPRRQKAGGRNDRPLIEHYIHGDLRYRLFDNGEDQMDGLHENMGPGNRVWNMDVYEDVEEMFDTRRVQKASRGTPKYPTEWHRNPDPAGYSNPPSGTVVLELDFMWSIHRHPHAYRIATTRSRSIGDGYSLHIQDSNYYNFTESMSGILNTLLNKGETARHVTVIMSAAFPSRTYTANADLEKSNKEQQTFCDDTKAREKNIFCLDFNGLSAMLSGGLNEPPHEARCDELHFMTNFVPYWPKQLQSMKPAYCPNNPLRDDVNAAAVHVLLDHLPLLHNRL